MISDFDISVPKRKPERIEMFNLRNKNCQEIFTKETDVNAQLVDCFENELPFEVQTRNWLKTFNDILFKCFKKVRVVKNNKKDKTETLMKERISLKQEVKLSTVDEDMKIKIELSSFI